MRNRMLIISILGSMIEVLLLFLGWCMGVVGLDGVSGILYVLAAVNFIAMVIFSRCPRCGWPLVIDVRRWRRDCPSCHTPIDQL